MPSCHDSNTIFGGTSHHLTTFFCHRRKQSIPSFPDVEAFVNKFCSFRNYNFEFGGNICCVHENNFDRLIEVKNAIIITTSKDFVLTKYGTEIRSATRVIVTPTVTFIWRMMKYATITMILPMILAVTSGWLLNLVCISQIYKLSVQFIIYRPQFPRHIFLKWITFEQFN